MLFRAGAIQFAVMRPAERDRKLLLRTPARLRKAHVVRITGSRLEDETGLFRHQPQVLEQRSSIFRLLFVFHIPAGNRFRHFFEGHQS